MRRLTQFTLLALCLPFLGSCSKYDVVRLASAKNPEQALAQLASSKKAQYQTNPLSLVQDIKRVRSNFNELVAFLKGEAGKSWGEGNVVTPSNKRYVKYTQNYKSRAIVEFDKGIVTVETVDTESPEKSLQSAIVTTLLTPDDPRSVDLYSDKTVKLSGQPYLYDLVLDQDKKPVGTPWRAERFADYLLKNKKQTGNVDGKSVSYVKIAMVSDYENRQAKKYEPLVNTYAKQYGVSKSLVFAVMKTESNFNPYAVSTAPAYGLMQLVPSTGGRDAFQTVKGYDHTPSKDYLFVPQNNIELGTAYLSIIDQRYLAKIVDPVKREYCVISAYNGGAGNVLRTFSSNRDQAVEIINQTSAAEVYRRLRDEHPRDETRRYLVKVLTFRREFVNI